MNFHSVRLPKPLILLLIALAFAAMEQAPAFAFGSPSASSLLPLCKYAAWKPKPYLKEEEKLAEECRSMLKVSINHGPSQPTKLSSCVPHSASMRDVASVVVTYIERHTARQKERFDILSSLALHHVWPCNS